jgi:ribosomal protein S18 acetylase RimI-like enzyme
LERELPAIRPAEGFAIRDLVAANESEIERRVEAHQQAFNSKRVSVESYHNLMNGLGYLPELDVIAVAPNGKIASYCNGWIDPMNLSGYIEPMGTPPEFQRMGLGKAVLTEALRRFQSMGCLTAAVASEAGNAASNALYRSVGFEPYRMVKRYRKEIIETDE